jgi:tetratricopeptide (TPR) repeat protein
MPEPTEAELRERLARGSQDPEHYRDLAELLLATNRPEESLAVLQRALDLPLPGLDRARLCAEVGWGWYDAVGGSVDRALGFAREATALLADEPETVEALALRGAARCLLAHCLFRTDAPASIDPARSAVNDLERALREAQASDSEWVLWGHYDAARAYSLLEDGEQAVAHARAFLDHELPEHKRLSGLGILSEACRQAGRLDEGERSVDEALALARARGEPLQPLYHTRGLILRAAGRSAEARASFEQELATLQSHPVLRDDPEWLKAVHGNLGELYYEAQDYERAAIAFEQCLAQYPADHPGRPIMLLWAAQSHRGRGDSEKARACFQAVADSPVALEEDRHQAEGEVLRCSARLAFAAGEFETAPRQLDELLRALPEDGSDRRLALNLLGHCYYSLHRYDEALACYDEVRSSPHAGSEERAEAEEWADWSAGERLYEAGEYGQAAASFERLVELYPEDHASHWAALMWLAGCYEGVGASTGARDCYQAVVRSRQATEAQRTQARAGLTRLA